MESLLLTPLQFMGFFPFDSPLLYAFDFFVGVFSCSEQVSPFKQLLFSCSSIEATETITKYVKTILKKYSIV